MPGEAPAGIVTFEDESFQLDGVIDTHDTSATADQDQIYRRIQRDRADNSR